MVEFIRASLDSIDSNKKSAISVTHHDENVIYVAITPQRSANWQLDPVAQARLANTREGTLLFFRRVLPATGSFCYAYMAKSADPTKDVFTRAMVNNHEELLEGINKYRGVDTWFSTASFKDTTSSAGYNVAELKSFRVDIESGLAGHKTPSKYATDDEAVKHLFAFCDEIHIPYPGLLYSGHGTHGYWTLKATISRVRKGLFWR